jgi:hypothetical protein
MQMQCICEEWTVTYADMGNNYSYNFTLSLHITFLLV